MWPKDKDALHTLARWFIKKKSNLQKKKIYFFLTLTATLDLTHSFLWLHLGLDKLTKQLSDSPAVSQQTRLTVSDKHRLIIQTDEVTASQQARALKAEARPIGSRQQAAIDYCCHCYCLSFYFHCTSPYVSGNNFITRFQIMIISLLIWKQTFVPWVRWDETTYWTKLRPERSFAACSRCVGTKMVSDMDLWWNRKHLAAMF